jgi:alpha-mannosidase
MAKGHQAVIRRSLNLPEWVRIRLSELSHWRLVASAPVGGWQIRKADYRGPGDYRFVGRWRAINEGDLWGEPDGTFFFRCRIKAPTKFRGLPAVLHVPTPTEMLVRVGGRIINAFDPNRHDVPLLRRVRGREALDVEMEAYVRSAPDDQRAGQVLGEGHGCTHIWHTPTLVSYDRVYGDFLNDLTVAIDTAACASVDEDVRAFLWHHVDETVKKLDRDTADRRSFHASVAAARAYLKANVYDAQGMSSPGRLALVGHSHLDVAYHWRIKQGIRKNARTTAVQLALMDEYPELLYCHTQPYLYEQLKRHWPELFERVRRKVRSGQWEMVGGPYVEPDCNTPSGESLIRQCLLGKQFYLDEFGVDVDTCWLPDVFGNSWIMPQILKKAGIPYFVSNKMSTWNDTNRFPHTNFVWRGCDGSEVKACVPASHFISWLAPDQLLANWDGFAEKVAVGESMNMFGFGDGGGGITREMMETARRITAFPGLPRTRLVSGKQYLDEAFAPGRKLSTWDDELYLEMHRGTSTTKAILKKLNRRCELMAREAEIFGTLAELLGCGKAPRQRLTDAWKTVLVNQFHDILPGSHTNPVAVEAQASYEQALGEFTAMRDHAAECLAAKVDTAGQPGQPVVVFNSLNWPRSGLVELPVRGGESVGAVAADGRPLPTQAVKGDDGSARLLVLADQVPALGYATLFVRKRPSGQPPTADVLAAAQTRHGIELENAFLRLAIDRDGCLASLVDKATGRQVIEPGAKGNELQLFEDKPGLYDAWDIVTTYKEKRYPLPAAQSVRLVESGPLRAVVRVERRFFASRLVQDIVVYAHQRQIDFQTFVDWHERNRLLKVAFPVAVLARRATYDLSYGSIQRSTGSNTSWDRARFEVTGHFWADLSESGFGVSLLNDCKYGHDIEGSRMRLSLLRGPVRPDPLSDQGEHRFTYSLLPHEGTWQQGGTTQAAWQLNVPLVAVAARRHEGKLPPVSSLATVQGPGVLLGALKPALRGKGVVVRLAELYGGRGSATVRLPGAKAASECDLLERPLRKTALRRGQIVTSVTPFEIKSLRFG